MAKITTRNGTRFLGQLELQYFSDDKEAKEAIQLLHNKLLDIERAMPSSDYAVILYDGVLTIDGIEISDKVLDNDDLDYRFVDREDEIEILKSEIRSGARESERWMVDNDIRELESYSDRVVLSSTGTNEYVSQFEDPATFDVFCKAVLELNKAVEKVED